MVTATVGFQESERISSAVSRYFESDTELHA